MLASVLVLHGPNLNLLGSREPSVYGTQTLSDINTMLREQAKVAGVSLVDFQSNHEGALIDRIHQAVEEKINWIIINPGAYTHTSIGLRDALLGVSIPFIEVHLSNVYRRESFRHHSFLSDVAVGGIFGLGSEGYRLALDFVLTQIKQNEAVS